VTFDWRDLQMTPSNLLVKGAQILDVSTGEAKKRDLAISNGLVVDANSIVDPKIIDASDLHVMFGLWDCHAHPGGLMYDPYAQGYFEGPAEWAVRAGANLMDAALMGVTGIRTMAEANRIDLAWASGFATGIYSGPRIKCSGAGLRTTGGHGTAFPKRPIEVQWEWAVDGADQMRTAARSLIEQGVDWIKLMITGGLDS
jgi:imidazolonepropionase-like amidohydrolase